MRRLLLTFTLALAMTASGLAAQDTRPGLAVLPFENGGSYGQDKENFDALEKGIPGMLISELAQNPGARVVDRDNIQALLTEQDLGKDGRVDAATAARVGKLVGARYMIMGLFMDHFGRFRTDARIVDVETSEILKVVKVEGKREELFKLIQSLAEKLMAETRLPPLPAEIGRAAKSRDVPTEALTYYSRGLLYQDRGDRTRAAEYFRKALEVFPAYAEADASLKKVGG